MAGVAAAVAWLHSSQPTALVTVILEGAAQNPRRQLPITTLLCCHTIAIVAVVCLLCDCQILLQVQQMSSMPQQERYKGLWDALRRVPQREGGIQVGCCAQQQAIMQQQQG